MMDNTQIINLLNSDPVAQELLQSSIPARLAYIGTDGSPRVVTIGFYWNGRQIVVCTATSAPKVRALRANPKVALTIDTELVCFTSTTLWEASVMRHAPPPHSVIGKSIERCVNLSTNVT